MTLRENGFEYNSFCIGIHVTTAILSGYYSVLFQLKVRFIREDNETEVFIRITILDRHARCLNYVNFIISNLNTLYLMPVYRTVIIAAYGLCQMFCTGILHPLARFFYFILYNVRLKICFLLHKYGL